MLKMPLTPFSHFLLLFSTRENQSQMRVQLNIHYLNAQDSIQLYSANSTNATTVEWTLPDGTTNNNPSISYPYTTAGVLDFILRADNGTCFDIDTISIVIIDNLGLTKNKHELSLSIFPNPAQESITISAPNTQYTSNSILRLHDAAGKCIKTIHWHGQPNLCIDLNVLTAGLFHIC